MEYEKEIMKHGEIKTSKNKTREKEIENDAMRIAGVAAKSCSRMHNRHLVCIRRSGEEAGMGRRYLGRLSGAWRW